MKGYYIRRLFIEGEIENIRDIGPENDPIMVGDIGSLKCIPLSSIKTDKKEAVDWLQWEIEGLLESLRELIKEGE